MTNAELKAKLDELGVTYKGNASNATLEALLEAHTPVGDQAVAEEAEEGTEAEAETVETQEVEAEAEETPEATPVSVVPKDSEFLPFGALMLLNVKHQGVVFEKGTAVDLQDQKTLDHFRSNGWIQ